MSDNWVRQASKNSIEVRTLRLLYPKGTKNIRKYKIIQRGVNTHTARIILDATKLDVKDYDHTIDNYFIKHTYNRHKDDKIPLKKYDYKKILSIIKTADHIYWNIEKRRNGVIVYEKEYRKGRLIYLEEIRKNRRELAAKTMYWQKKQK